MKNISDKTAKQIGVLAFAFASENDFDFIYSVRAVGHPISKHFKYEDLLYSIMFISKDSPKERKKGVHMNIMTNGDIFARNFPYYDGVLELITVFNQRKIFELINSDMKKLPITGKVLDKIGFSEYWDEHGTWGGRTLKFSDGTRFRIIEQNEMDDEHEGYASMSNGVPTYIANHFYFVGWFALPKTESEHYDLFFLHEMYECIENEYPDCLEEFTIICKGMNMYPYIEEYLESRKK